MAKLRSRTVHGLWEEVLPQLKPRSVGLVFTDPPYEMSYLTNIPGDPRWNSNGKSRNKFDRPMKGDHSGGVYVDGMLYEIQRVLRPDSYLVLHASHAMLLNLRPDIFADHGFKLLGCITWRKGSSLGGNLVSAMKRSAEPILYLAKGSPKLNRIEVERNHKLVKRDRIDEVLDWQFSLPRDERCGVPTQKPVALCEQVINLMSRKGDVVLDPFAGSGSICLAARNLGRRYVGIECDLKTHRIMKKRLNGARC
jgi:site-specific DNA-methyltransferase (adenine-specific)